MANEGVVKALVSGALDWSGVATNASYDVFKYLGSKALKRLLDPTLRKRILLDAQHRMITLGLSPHQAQFLADMAREKEFLQRGALQDVARLSELIQTEVNERGYFPFEGEALYRALIQAITAQLSSDTFTGSLLVGNYLATNPTPFSNSAVIQYSQALQEPEKLGGALLGRILKDAGHPNAKLVVGADGTLELTGDYSITLSADGPDGAKLHDALQRVQNGETVVIEASQMGSIRFSAGHSVLDRIQGFDTPPQAVRFSPAPQTLRRTLSARVRGVGEVSVDAQVKLLPDRKGFVITLVDRPNLRFVLTMSAERISWNFVADWTETQPDYEDRKIMQFLMYATHPSGQIVDERGKHILRQGKRPKEFARVGWVAEANLYTIDLRQYVANELCGTFSLLLPRLNEKEFKTLRDMARQSRDELDGVSQKIRGTFLLTKDALHSLTGPTSKKGLYVEMTQFLSLPDSTPLKLTKNFVRPKVTVWQKGKRIPRAKWAALAGQEAEIVFNGPISDAKLEINPDELPVLDE